MRRIPFSVYCEEEARTSRLHLHRGAQTKGLVFQKGKIFYKRLPIAIDFQDFKLLYGISEQQVVNELFRVDGGQTGYYLEDLHHKKYHYCGMAVEAVKATLFGVGVTIALIISNFSQALSGQNRASISSHYHLARAISIEAKSREP